MRHRLSLGTVAALALVLSACGDDGPSTTALGATSPTTSAASASGSPAATAPQTTAAKSAVTTTKASGASTTSGDCPKYLKVAQVTEAMGMPMQANLFASNSLGTVCEWVAVKDSAISASFRTFEGDDKELFTSETRGTTRVTGLGDEAFRVTSPLLGPLDLYVRSGNLLFTVFVQDTNRRSGIDAQAISDKLARVVLANK
jgi:hypothetical protein